MSITKKLLQAASGNAGSDNLYVEDVFSTYLYDGTGATHNIVNGIDLSGEGGMVWSKTRDTDVRHGLVDTERGAAAMLTPNENWANQTTTDSTLSFNSDGYTLGADAGNQRVNNSAYDYVGWTFRNAEKFFDVVTWTGNSTVGRTVAHNLGVAPAWMVIKCTNAARNWCTYHISLGNGYQIILSGSAAKESTALWNYTTPTATEFTLGNDADVNGTGNTYVAYLFASDAGGFGDDSDENIIKCGSFTTDSNAKFFANTGFEPQWVLVKRSDGTGAWNLLDTMRGLLSEGTAGGKYLRPNTSGAEGNLSSTASEYINSTGFGGNGGGVTGSANATFIYIAIRRPMKTPESGTEVFALHNPGYPLNSAGEAFTSGFPVDWALSKEVSATDDWIAMSRLQGAGNRLKPNTTVAEAGGISSGTFDHMTGWYKTTSANMSWMFKRATGFFDVVAWTGAAGTLNAVTHGLGVKPELVILKYRTVNDGWYVYTSAAGHLSLEGNSGLIGSTDYMASTTDTSLNVTGLVSNPGNSPIAYLFATVAGVSKVGSYTGTGADLNVDCGFSAGARFVLIKRTDATGNWFIYDSVRGIVAGADSYLLLNSTAAEDSANDDIDPLSSGFSIPSGSNVNASGGTYIFLAIA